MYSTWLQSRTHNGYVGGLQKDNIKGYHVNYYMKGYHAGSCVRARPRARARAGLGYYNMKGYHASSRMCSVYYLWFMN